MERAKSDQKDWKKRVNDATRVLQREEPNLKEAQTKLTDFEKHLELMGFSLDSSDFPMSSTLASSSTPVASSMNSASVDSSEPNSRLSSSTLFQVNEDCLMPSYESKAVIQKTPKKILQGLLNF